MKKRIFVAIMASKSIKERVLAWRKTYYDFPFRWIKAKNLHLTLFPPWEEQNPEVISKKLQILTNQIHPFELNFNYIEYGPSLRKARLIWLRGEDNPDLLKLQTNISNLLKGIQKTKNQKEYKPHLTIARFNSRDLKKLPKIHTKIQWKQQIGSLALVESVQIERQTEYKILVKLPFNF